MKLWKVCLVMAVTVVAVLLMTSVVFAAPAATNSAPLNRADADPLDSTLTDTLPLTHPVGYLIALYFNIPYTQVMALHSEGIGFGNIARAYLTALQSNGALTPDQILAMREAGTGWGEIKKQYGIHPGGNGLGTIMREHGTPQPPVAPVTDDKQDKKDKGGNPGSATCPGNSCNAPGHNKSGQGPKK